MHGAVLKPVGPARGPHVRSRGVTAQIGLTGGGGNPCAGGRVAAGGADSAPTWREFPDGWALSTSAAALQQVLALCPPGVRVCSWQRAVRPTKSKRPISAWEPLIASGGRELATDGPQVVRDALAYGGRYRRFPGALIGMKPPQCAAWLFAQLGARPGDQLEDLFPGSGAIGEAWRRYTSQPLSERGETAV